MASTKTAKTAECTHGLPSGACVACSKTAKTAKTASLTLATVPVVLGVPAVVDGKNGERRATLEAFEGRNGSYRASLAPTGVLPDADGRKSSGLAFPSPEDVFGTARVPSSVRFVVGGVTATGRPKRGATVVEVPTAVEVKDDRPQPVVSGTASLTHDGEPFVASVRVRVTRSGGWYVTATVRPGRAPAPTKRAASASLDGNPFA